jgi:hypothetical protein
VLATAGARPRRRFERRRAREAAGEPEPAPVAITRATVIAVDAPLPGDPAAQAWLEAAHDGGQDEAQDALRVLNDVLRAHRAAAADPYARDVAAPQALVSRVGYGDGEQVAEGRWAAALELDLRPRRPPRTAALRPQERLAALLSGRDRRLACEELVLRARLDLDEGRPREAALQLRVALEAALSELEADSGVEGMVERLSELRERRGAVASAANTALDGALDPATVDEVTAVVERLEAALRARTASGV